MAISKMIGGIIILVAFVVAGKAHAIDLDKAVMVDQQIYSNLIRF